MRDQFKVVRETVGAAKEVAGLTADSSHHEIAEDWINSQEAPGVVGAEDKLFRFDVNSGLWGALPLERVEVELGRRYTGLKSCRRKSDYTQIARHIHNIVLAPTFFEAAPLGLATPAGFYTVRDGELTCVPLTHELRQRFGVPIIPADGPSVVFDTFLDMAFDNEDHEITLEQQRLAQECVGAVVMGLLYQYEKVVLLLGGGGSGKSTFLRLIESLIPREFVCAVSPFKWEDDYGIAGMANKRLNLVGELPGDKPIPTVFKQVTGRDRITGRLPYGKPFDFRPVLSHVFNSNHFIATRDHSSGFWRRWLVLAFDNLVPAADQDKNLDRQIIEHELPAVLHWALQGAARVLERDGFTESKRSESSINRWRTATDAVAEFLGDEEYITDTRDAETGAPRFVERTALYDAFKEWARDAGRKVVGRAQFYDRAQQMGFRVKKIHGVRYVEGLEIRR